MRIVARNVEGRGVSVKDEQSKNKRVKVDLTRHVTDEEHERIVRSNARAQAERDLDNVKSWKPRGTRKD